MRGRTLAAMGTAVFLFLMAQVIFAQGAAPAAYFIGIEDQNSDGVSNARDGLNLYAVNGETSSRVNADDENVRSYVAQFSRSSVAYVALLADDTETLTTVDGAGHRLSTPLVGLKNAIVQRLDDVVWITALDTAEQPCIVGFDGDLVETIRAVVPFARPAITFSPTGKWVFAFDVTAQKLQLYSLPTLTPLPLDLPSTIWGPPVLAPQSDTFALPIANQDDSSRLEIAIVEPPTGIISTVGTDLAATTQNRVQVQWSDDGGFLTYRARPDDEPSSASEVTLIDADARTVSRLEEADLQLRVVNWSSNDRYALISQAPALVATEQISLTYRIFDPVSDQYVAGDPVNTFVAPVAFAWQPARNVLAMLGRSLVDGKPGIFTFDVDTGAISTLYNTDDAGLLHGNLFWSADGSHILFTVKRTDPLSVLSGLNDSLHILNVNSGLASTLSPDNVTVLPYGIQVR